MNLPLISDARLSPHFENKHIKILLINKLGGHRQRVLSWANAARCSYYDRRRDDANGKAEKRFRTTVCWCWLFAKKILPLKRSVESEPWCGKKKKKKKKKNPPKRNPVCPDMKPVIVLPVSTLICCSLLGMVIKAQRWGQLQDVSLKS